MVLLTGRTKFMFPISDGQRTRYQFIINYLAMQMGKYYPDKDIFQKLTTIEVYDAAKRSPEMIQFKAIGLAFFNGRIQTCFFDNSTDIDVASMELAHNAMLALLPGPENYDEMNNLVHRAANNPKTVDGKDTYMPGARVRYWATLADRQSGGQPLILNIGWYNLMLLLRDMGPINESIKNKTAPIGPHQYRDVNDATYTALKDAGIVPGSAEDDHHLDEYLSKPKFDSITDAPAASDDEEYVGHDLSMHQH